MQTKASLLGRSGGVHLSNGTMCVDEGMVSIYKTTFKITYYMPTNDLMSF